MTIKSEGQMSQEHTEVSLHKAVENKNIDEVKRFLEEGVDVNEQDALGMTPLHIAIIEHYYECAKYLIEEKNADVNITSPFVGHPIFSAIRELADEREDLSELLIKNGASLTVRDERGYTPLHIAVHEGLEKITTLILNTDDSQINDKANDDKFTALDIARHYGQEISFTGEKQTSPLEQVLIEHNGK